MRGRQPVEGSPVLWAWGRDKKGAQGQGQGEQGARGSKTDGWRGKQACQGLGQRRRAGQTLIEETAGFANEAEIKQILNMFRNNPEARDAFRHGMRQRVYQTSTDVGSNPMIERALIGEGKAKDVVRLLFDEGAEGERAFNEFLRQAKMERSSDRASRALARGAGAAGRASVTRTLPLTR